MRHRSAGQWLWIVCLAVGGGVLLLGGSALGVRSAMAQPTSVAVVDVPRVMAKLNLRAELEAELAVMTESNRAEDEQRQKTLEAMQAELNEVPESDEAARERQGEALALAVLEYNAWRAYATEQLDIDKSIRLRDIDRKIRSAIADLAQLNGYDIVLMDDTSQSLVANPESNVPRDMQIKQQMTRRRVLYAAPAVDISEELIERMNNEFNAG